MQMANNLGAYKKKKQSVDNIIERQKLLIKSIKNPEGVNKVLAHSLKGQKQFANLNIEKTSINPLSLNTVKSISEEIFSGNEYEISGFEYFNNLRKTLLKLLGSKKSNRNNKQTTNIKRENDVLINKLSQVERLNIQRSNAYLDLFQRLRVIAKDKNIDDLTLLKLNNILDDHTILYRELLSPTVSENSSATLHILDSNKNE
jgi:hypothetical protein